MNKKNALGNFSLASLSSMKLPKGITTTHLILIVVSVILLALTIYFTVLYFGAAADKNDLEKQITQKQTQLNSMGEMQNIAALESQLEQAREDLAENSPFPEVVKNTDVAYSIILAAREASITCFSYDSDDPKIYTINGNDYIENIYGISVQETDSETGEKISRIIRFLTELEETYDNSIVTSASMSDGESDDLWVIDFDYSVISLK